MICQDWVDAAKAQATTGAVPQERTAEYYKKRPCRELVKDCVKIIEKHFKL